MFMLLKETSINILKIPNIVTMLTIVHHQNSKEKVIIEIKLRNPILKKVNTVQNEWMNELMKDHVADLKS